MEQLGKIERRNSQDFLTYNGRVRETMKKNYWTKYINHQNYLNKASGKWNLLAYSQEIPVRLLMVEEKKFEHLL